MGQLNKIRASFIELFNRETKLNTKDKVYLNGANNLYPNEIERVINNSPTGKRALNMMAKFIAGSGISGENKLVHKKKAYRITDLIKLIATDLCRHGGAFIWVGYGIEGDKIVPVQWDVLDYSMCRIKKEDDDGNEGNILYKDYTANGVMRKGDDGTTFFPFTMSQKVLLKQIQTYGDVLEDAVKAFPGNVFFLNPSNYTYPLSYFDQVYNDCDTEYRIGLYINSSSRLGFLGKTVVVTQGLDEEQGEKVKEDVSKWLGAENAQGLFHMNVEFAEDVTKVLHVQQLESQFDDKMFDQTKVSIRRNIIGAANNIPESLVFASEGALFGSSGEAYKEMKEFYNEQTQSERELIEQTLATIGIITTITPLI